MIQWKQRLYAFLLRRVLSPFLDASSKLKLHESIEVSFQEGTFALNNVCLCTSYLNSLELGAVNIKTARVESISIQLSLLEDWQTDASKNRDDLEPVARHSSSLAWRAMNLGSKVSLVAHIEINGVEVEVDPLPANARSSHQPKDSNTQAHPCPSKTEKTLKTSEEPSSQSILSSYIEAALASLRLTLKMTNFTLRLCHRKGLEDPTTTAWVELRMPSLSYHDLENSSSITQNRHSSQSTKATTMLEKAVIFQGISIVAGETVLANASDEGNTSLSSTIAVAEGSGQVSLLVVEYQPRYQTSGEERQVQQDIDIRLSQQVKVSVDETSLLQLHAIIQGFQSVPDCAVDGADVRSRDVNNTHKRSREEASSENANLVGAIDEMEQYTIDGIMKQYEEARKLAERNELRGGILVPSSAFEEGENIGEGDPRTFDVFFDANDKSFHNYASMLRDSMMASQGGDATLADFVHTKVNLHLLGGGAKVSFRNRSNESALSSKPDEYILLTFSELSLSSTVSLRSADLALYISHVEIDDAQLDCNGCPTDLKVEIGNVLSFSQVSFIMLNS
jgi:hypothetical protein